jgi:hypothetical protein
MPSALVPQIVEAPGLGLIRNHDPRHVPDNAWSNGRNIRFITGKTRVRKTDGYARVDDTFPAEPIRALWWYIPIVASGTETLVRIGTSGVWNGIGSARQSVMTFDPARTAEDVLTVQQYKERLIWADGIGSVYAWNGTAPAAPIGGGAPTGKLVEIHKEHVLIANHTIPDVPYRVAYSVLGLITPADQPTTGVPDFTGEGSGDFDLLDDASGITALKVMGDQCIVHKKNRIYRMTYVGFPSWYNVEGIAADEGAMSARSPISVGSYQYYMGHTNFFRLGSYAEAIGDAIWPEIANAIDWPRAHLIFAYRRDQYDEICWKIPTRGEAQPSLTAAYNVRDQTWSLTDHDPGLCAAQVPSDALASTAYGDAHSPISPPPVRDLLGQMSGLIHVYGGRDADGAPIHAWIESRHFSDQLAPAKILAVPVFATGQGDLIVQLRAAMDARQPLPPWPTAPPSSAFYHLDAPQTRPWVDVRGYGRLWQIRLESRVGGDDWEVEAYGTASIPGGYAR